jgi:hypothetical protein
MLSLTTTGLTYLWELPLHRTHTNELHELQGNFRNSHHLSRSAYKLTVSAACLYQLRSCTSVTRGMTEVQTACGECKDLSSECRTCDSTTGVSSVLQ